MQSTASPHRHLVGCDGWGSRLTIYIANSPIIIDHHRSPTLREEIDFSITSHFQMASTEQRAMLCVSTACADIRMALHVLQFYTNRFRLHSAAINRNQSLTHLPVLLSSVWWYHHLLYVTCEMMATYNEIWHPCFISFSSHPSKLFAVVLVWEVICWT